MVMKNHIKLTLIKECRISEMLGIFILMHYFNTFYIICVPYFIN